MNVPNPINFKRRSMTEKIIIGVSLVFVVLTSYFVFTGEVSSSGSTPRTPLAAITYAPNNAARYVRNAFGLDKEKEEEKKPGYWTQAGQLVVDHPWISAGTAIVAYGSGAWKYNSRWSWLEGGYVQGFVRGSAELAGAGIKYVFNLVGGSKSESNISLKNKN